ncbi:cache domain-containing protein [Xanthobacteraceae bacterium A53D]
MWRNWSWADRHREAPQGTRRLRARWRLLLVAGAAGLLALFVLAVALTDRAAEMDLARERVSRHVAGVAEHMSAVGSGFGLALDQVVQEIGERDIAALRADRPIHQLLVSLKNRLPNAESVFIVDAEGRTVASSRAFPMPPYDVRERDYFIEARAGHAGLYVSSPFRGQMSRSTSFVLSQPVMRDGKLAGVVGITVFPNVLTSTYQEMLGDADMVLARADGTVLIRTDGARAVERLPERSEVMRRVEREESGVFSGASFINGEPAVQGVRTLPGGDMVAAVALDDGVALAGWYRRALMMGGGAALALAGLVAWALARESTHPQKRPWWLGPRSRRQTLPGEGAGALPVVELITERLGVALEGTPAAGAAICLRTLAAWLGGAPSSPSRIDLAEAVNAVQALLVGARLPMIELQQGEARPLVLADPCRLELAIIDLVIGLSAVAPAAERMSVSIDLRRPELAGVKGLPEGEQVRLRLDAAEAAERAQDVGPDPDRFALAGVFATEAGGAVVRPLAGGPLRVELWLPRDAAARASE